jgi:hypothetical protein
MTEYKTIMDNKKAIRKFNYVIAKYKNKVVRGKIKSFVLASTRNRINQIELDTKSLFKFIIPSDYDSIKLINKVGNRYETIITLETR